VVDEQLGAVAHPPRLEGGGRSTCHPAWRPTSDCGRHVVAAT